MKHGLSLRIAFFITFCFIFCFTSSRALAVTGVYPVEPKFGIQSVSYTISGANLTSFTDVTSGFVGRNYKGTLGTGVLRVQGTVTATDNMRSAYMKVFVGLGAGGNGCSKEYEVRFGRGEQVSFDVSIPIPADLTNCGIKDFGASFSIFINSFEYIDKDGWRSSGTFDISGNVRASTTAPNNHPPTVTLNHSPEQPTVGNTVNFIASAADADGDNLSYAWYFDGVLQNGAVTNTVNWSQPSIGAHTLRVVVNDGKGGEAEDTTSFTVTNPGAEPYVIAPGYNEGEGEGWGFVDKVIINGQEVAGITQTILYNGSRVKTGPGVEIILRTSFGAVTRITENSTYEVEVRRFAITPTTVVVGRLIDGIGEFYWPKGHAGAEKFQVSTNRIVVGIKGTTFTVSQINDVSSVSVQEGVVQVTNLDTGTITQVSAGSSLTAADKGGYVNGAYNYYVPSYSSTNGNWTGLGLANNNSSASALVQVSVYHRDGHLLKTEKKLIAVGGQEALPVAGELNANGWMLVNSHQPLSGLAFISANGTPALMADIPFVNKLSTDLVIPHVAQDNLWDTSILICNPHQNENEIYFELVDTNGISQGIESRQLPPMGSGKYPLSSLFPGVSLETGKIIVTSFTEGIAAFALYSNRKSPNGSYYAGINAVDSGSFFRLATPTFAYYLPYFSSANKDWTGLALTNVDMLGKVEPQITIYNESGTVQSSTKVDINIWGQTAFALKPPTINRGWIQVNSDGPLNGLAFIGTGGTPSLMADIPFVKSLSTNLVIPHVAQDATWDTTLLLCNPAAQSATIRIVNFNQLGEIGAVVNKTIAAQGSARYELSTLFTGHPEIGGKINITSTTGLAGFALYSNKKSGGSYFAGINAEPGN